MKITHKEDSDNYRTVNVSFTIKAKAMTAEQIKTEGNKQVATVAESITGTSGLTGAPNIDQVTTGLSTTSSGKTINVAGTGVTKPTVADTNLSDALGFVKPTYKTGEWVIVAAGFAKPANAYCATTGNGIEYDVHADPDGLLLYIPLKINEAGNGVENATVTIQWWLDEECTVKLGDAVTYTVAANNVTFAASGTP